jgi:hypothetical protein
MNLETVSTKGSMSDEKGGRRCGQDRRVFSYAVCLPERRTGQDRRSGQDRRKTGRYQRVRNWQNLSIARFSKAVTVEDRGSEAIQEKALFNSEPCQTASVPENEGYKS